MGSRGGGARAGGVNGVAASASWADRAHGRSSRGLRMGQRRPRAARVRERRRTLGVALLNLFGAILQVNQLAEEADVDEEKLGVDGGVLGRREARLRFELLRVERLPLVGRELRQPVVRHLDVLVPVELQQVAAPEVRQGW